MIFLSFGLNPDSASWPHLSQINFYLASAMLIFNFSFSFRISSSRSLRIFEFSYVIALIAFDYLRKSSLYPYLCDS